MSSAIIFLGCSRTRIRISAVRLVPAAAPNGTFEFLGPSANREGDDTIPGIAYKIALIGSFRQHYDAVLSVLRIFRGAGYEITSPKGDPVVEPGISFVLFTSDPQSADDPMVQTIALHRILRADFVYVVNPSGYIGRTTAYEIGRVIQFGRPIFFSEQPEDLPLLVPETHVKTASEIVDAIRNDSIVLTRLFEGPADDYSRAEQDLFHRRLRDE